MSTYLNEFPQLRLFVICYLIILLRLEIHRAVTEATLQSLLLLNNISQHTGGFTSI